MTARETTWVPIRRLHYDVGSRRVASVYHRACPFGEVTTVRAFLFNLYLLFAHKQPQTPCSRLFISGVLHRRITHCASVFAPTSLRQVCAALRRQLRSHCDISEVVEHLGFSQSSKDSIETVMVSISATCCSRLLTVRSSSDTVATMQGSTDIKMSETNDTRRNRKEGEYSDTIHVQRPRSSKSSSAFLTPKLPPAALSTSPSSSGGMENISLTSPSVCESVQKGASNTPKRTPAPYVPERTLSSAVRRLVAQPGPSKGSADDPILLEEYSPRRKPLTLPKRQEQSQNPQKFQNKHQKMNKPLPARRALAPKPTNASTFTGDKSNDMNKMRNAKAAVVDWTPPLLQSNIGYGVSFESLYPRSAQFLAQRSAPVTRGQSRYTHTQSPYTNHQTDTVVPLSGASEDMLRKRALQHIRDSSRPQHLKKMLSDDPDETSASETEYPRTGKKLHVYQDANDHISPLISQTSILTSLLQVYPRSTDQKGLREDISMLVNVQNRGMNQWIKDEKKKDSTVERAKKAVDGLLAKEREQRQRDEEVRSLLSAQAGIWADGSGEGVVDVFAAGDGKEGDEDRSDQRGVKRKFGVCGWDMVE